MRTFQRSRVCEYDVQKDIQRQQEHGAIELNDFVFVYIVHGNDNVLLFYVLLKLCLLIEYFLFVNH